jgi:hypothetical protein
MDLTALIPVLLVVLALIGLAVGAMILGQRATGRCLQGGTCGSRAVRGPNGEDLSCTSCSNRKANAPISPPTPPASAA